MSGASYFHAALAADETYEVPMNSVLFIRFQGPKRAVGTQNLNGCTAVAIVSGWGAILAHIPPVPHITLSPHAGMQNLQVKMARGCGIISTNSSYFPRGVKPLVVGALYQDQPALPDHLEYIRGLLTEYQLIPELRLYQVSTRGHASAGQGTVFIDARQGQPVVYVENQPVALS